jgi:hypothetical protein
LVYLCTHGNRFLPQCLCTKRSNYWNRTLISTTTQNGTPIYRSSTASTFDYAQSVQLLTQTDLSSAGISSGDVITKISFKKTTIHTLAPGRTASMSIHMKNSSATALVTNQNFATWTTGSDIVFSNNALTPNDFPTTANEWVDFVLNVPFTYTGGSIEIAINWQVNAGTGNRSTGAFQWEYTTTPTNQSVGTSGSSPHNR